MFGLSFGSVQLAGIFKLTIEEAIGSVATRATVIVVNQPASFLPSISKDALLTANSKVTIIRTNKR